MTTQRSREESKETERAPAEVVISLYRSRKIKPLLQRHFYVSHCSKSEFPWLAFTHRALSPRQKTTKKNPGDCTNGLHNLLRAAGSIDKFTSLPISTNKRVFSNDLEPSWGAVAIPVPPPPPPPPPPRSAMWPVMMSCTIAALRNEIISSQYWQRFLVERSLGEH